MKCDITIDRELKEVNVHIHTPSMTKDVERLEAFITSDGSTQLGSRLIGCQGTSAVPLQPGHIIRIQTQSKAVFAHTKQGEFRLRSTISELTDSLPASDFIRINQGEIVNLDHVLHMDMSATRTIGITLRDGSRSFVSRRRLKDIRAALNI